MTLFQRLKSIFAHSSMPRYFLGILIVFQLFFAIFISQTTYSIVDANSNIQKYHQDSKNLYQNVNELTINTYRMSNNIYNLITTKNSTYKQYYDTNYVSNDYLLKEINIQYFKKASVFSKTTYTTLIDALNNLKNSYKTIITYNKLILNNYDNNAFSSDILKLYNSIKYQNFYEELYTQTLTLTSAITRANSTDLQYFNDKFKTASNRFLILIIINLLFSILVILFTIYIQRKNLRNTDLINKTISAFSYYLFEINMKNKTVQIIASNSKKNKTYTACHYEQALLSPKIAIHTSDLQLVKDFYDSVFTNDFNEIPTLSLDYRALDGTKKMHWIRTIIKPDKIVRGEIVTLLGMNLNIDSFKATETALKEESNTDALTGLFNKKYFNTNFKRLFDLACEENRLFSAIIFDVDYFKQYNDNYGHLKGDQVLKTISNIISAHLTPSQYAVRFGGEEFLVFCLDLPKSDTISLATKIIGDIESKKIEHDKSPYKIITVSAGVGFYNPVSNSFADANQFLDEVDKSLYYAKLGGRNTLIPIDSNAYCRIKRLQQRLTQTCSSLSEINDVTLTTTLTGLLLNILTYTNCENALLYLVSSMCTLLNISSTRFVLFDKENNAITFPYAYCLENSNVPSTYSPNLTLEDYEKVENALSSTTYFYCEDITKESLPKQNILTELNIKSLACARIYVRGKQIGTLICSYKEAHKWSDQEIEAIKLSSDIFTILYKRNINEIEPDLFA